MTWRRTRPGDPVRRRLALAAALLAVQILLGALTVWLMLAVVDGHGASPGRQRDRRDVRVDRARAARTPPAHPPRARRRTPGQRRALAAVIALLAFQLVLGGLVSSRYAGLACPEWPTCNGGLWFPSWRGRSGCTSCTARTATCCSSRSPALARICRASPRLARWTRAAERLGAAQIAVGIANVLTKIPVELTGLHSALAAALVLTATGAAHAAWAPCYTLRPEG